MQLQQKECAREWYRSPECAVGEQELLQESEQQAAISQLESMSCQEGSLYCQECMSYQEIKGRCKRAWSAEQARIAARESEGY